MADEQTHTQQQAEELDRALHAQYRADARLAVGSPELESWRQVRRAAVDKVFRADSRARGRKERIDET